MGLATINYQRTSSQPWSASQNINQSFMNGFRVNHVVIRLVSCKSWCDQDRSCESPPVKITTVLSASASLSTTSRIIPTL